MCGIIGIISHKDVAPRLIAGLKSLEYRGYDSAGVALLSENQIDRRRASGKLIELENLVLNSPISGNIGIGHTRWATHGAPTQENAHPHASKTVALVHNGIIENYLEFKDKLIAQGHVFQSETDTEVVVHLLTQYLLEGLTPLQAVQRALKEITGAFAFAILFKDYEDLLIVARRGSPLVIGYGDQEMAIGSDALALASWTQKLSYLEDGDYAVITKQDVQIYDQKNVKVSRPIKQSKLSRDAVTKNGYSHFMLKEIFEQPKAIEETLRSVSDLSQGKIISPPFTFDWGQVPRLTLIACGTAYLAGLTAKYWFEKYAKLPVDVEIASEFRYRDPYLTPGGVSAFISQSGETIDTLSALHLAQAQGQHTLAIVNVEESSIARAAQNQMITRAGPEIGVASTKAFTSQLTVLASLAISAGRIRGVLSDSQERALVAELASLPAQIMKVLQNDQDIHDIAEKICHASSSLYLGRGTSYPIALEGALKLKELSYIHAEGYPAGEMKHGPIALIDKTVPIIILAPHDHWFDKTISNMQEVLARGGAVICFTDADGAKRIQAMNDTVHIFCLPKTDHFIAPILYTIPMQLLAYHTALLRGADVDQPRNLAKSVTVE